MNWAGKGVVCLLAAVATVSGAPAATSCHIMTTYQAVNVYRFNNSDAYTYWLDHIAIDADGAPNAYGPDDQGLDSLRDAGYPNGHWKNTLVPDPDNPSTPFVQRCGPFKGFYVSMTALTDPAKCATDPSRYVDARTVPYVVFPRSFYNEHGTGQLGDVGIAMDMSNGKSSEFIIADIGSETEELGEISIKLAENLGGTNVNPRNGAGAPSGPILYVVFPEDPMKGHARFSVDAIAARAEADLHALGGRKVISDCLQTR